MKRVIFILEIVGSLIYLQSCAGPKKLEKTTGAIEISVPFSEKKYRSDKEFIRATQSGKSPDLATAKKIALQNAKAELASSIKSLIKRVTEQYTNQRTVGDKQEFENKFEELSREVVDQNLTNIHIMDEKILKETDGRYSYFIVIEVNRESLLNSYSSKISKNEKLQLDIDKAKFEEIFNAEMSKMANE
jgi:hypothetical protein